jgi:hypothetical protein
LLFIYLNNRLKIGFLFFYNKENFKMQFFYFKQLIYLKLNNTTMKRNLKIISLLIILMNNSCSAPTFRIYEKPIIYDEERKSLSLDYLKTRHGIETDHTKIVPEMVVVHWTAIPSLESSFDAFNPVKLNGRPELTNASSLNVSAHFLVDRDGTIFRLLPANQFARHTIGLNYMAIGIENIGDEKSPLTKAQLKANTQLVRHLKRKYPISYLIGHHEYYDFRKSDLWKETDPNYITHKIDPGAKFMKKLRKKLSDLELKHHP